MKARDALYPLEQIIFASWDAIFDVDNVAELRIGRVHVIVKHVLAMHAAALQMQLDIRRKQNNIMGAIAYVLENGVLYNRQLANILGFTGVMPKKFQPLNHAIFNLLRHADYNNQPFFLENCVQVKHPQLGDGYTAPLNKFLGE